MTWNEVSTVLCVRLDAMGDVLMTSPAFRAAHDNQRRKITLLTSSSGAAIARHIPEISDVIVYDSPWMKASPLRCETMIDREMVETIARREFDAAIVFTTFSQSPLPAALLCYYAGIRLRLARCRENPYRLLTDWVRETEPEQGIQHEVTRQIDLLRHVGWRADNDALSLRVPRQAQRKMSVLLRSRGIRAPWMLVHPGATAPSRRYPPERYGEVARLLVEAGFTLVFSGDKSELGIVDEIRRAVPQQTVSFAGMLSLAELMALVQLAPVLLSNNTGPAHIAAALGTPIVDLYALTNPQHTPWRVPSVVLSHDVPCRNCFKSVCPEGHNNCLALIEPERVARACLTLWQQEYCDNQENTYVNVRN